MHSSVVTREQIVRGLSHLGVKPGMKVMVHSSLKSFGHVDGGPDTVIRAMMDAITPDGTLMMPSFNHGAAFEPGAAGFFDPTQTRTTNGAIPDRFWRYENVHRSLHPTHAFAAWGRDSARYVRHHHRTLTTGADSPLGLLWRDGGCGLLVGVDYRSNTFHHVVETVSSVPCLGWRSVRLRMRLPHGRMVEGRTWSWRDDVCPIDDTGSYAAEMQRRRLHRKIMIGRSELTFYQLQACFDVISGLLGQGYGEHPPCSRCPIRPRRDLEYGVVSDWDSNLQVLATDSPALQY